MMRTDDAGRQRYIERAASVHMRLTVLAGPARKFLGGDAFGRAHAMSTTMSPDHSGSLGGQSISPGGSQ